MANRIVFLILLVLAAAAVGEYRFGIHEHLSTDIGEERLEMMTILGEEATVIAAEMERRGYILTSGGYSNEYLSWEQFPEFAEFITQMGQRGPVLAEQMQSADIGEVISAIDEMNSFTARLNQFYLDFMGIGDDDLALLMGGQELSVPVEPEETEQEEYVTLNTAVRGDQEAVDQMRFRMDGIQGLYDVIADHAESGNYELARSNMDNLRSSLEITGQEAAQLWQEHSFTVTFTGLATDDAMSHYREIETDREQNHLFLQHVMQSLDEVRNAMEQQNRTLISQVLTTTCKSFIDWSQPPDWYEIPQTFNNWYQQSLEHAQAIEGTMNFVNNLVRIEADLENIRENASEYHEELVQQMEDMAPLLELHAEMGDLMRSVSWAAFVSGSQQ